VSGVGAMARRMGLNNRILCSISALRHARQPQIAPVMNKTGFRNGTRGVKSPVSASPSFDAPRERARQIALERARRRFSDSAVVAAGLVLPSVVGAKTATSCHQKKR
jgi:hypothetical protein